jgi:hypothetical protein
VIERAVAGCDGALVVLVPRGVHGYATGTAEAVLDYALPDARLVFSCGWHISLDGQDVYSWKLKALVNVAGPLAKLARFADLDDQVEACRRVFASDTRWTVVRGSDLEEGESQGLPVWSRRVGDPILESNLTRRVDFALFMVEAVENDELVHEAPAIVGRQSPSALAHVASALSAKSHGDRYGDARLRRGGGRAARALRRPCPAFRGRYPRVALRLCTRPQPLGLPGHRLRRPHDRHLPAVPARPRQHGAAGNGRRVVIGTGADHVVAQRNA